jgi:hypothetical protein
MSEMHSAETGEATRAQGSVEQSFETPGPVSLRVENACGKVEIETHDAPTTDVRVVALTHLAEELVGRARITERATTRGHEIIVEIPQGRGKARFWLGNGNAVGVSVRVPEDARLDVSTSSASVEASGRYLTASIRSSSGQVELGDIAGAAKVRTASGDIDLVAVGDLIEVQSASGDVRIGVTGAGGKIWTASGNVNLERAEKSIRIQSASGDVRLGEAFEGASVQSASGDQRIDRAAGGDYILNAVSGDIVVAVAPGTLIRFDTGSLSGRVSTDIEVGADRPVALEGEADGPELLIQAKTVSGDIKVTRAAS